MGAVPAESREGELEYAGRRVGVEAGGSGAAVTAGCLDRAGVVW